MHFVLALLVDHQIANEGPRDAGTKDLDIGIDSRARIYENKNCWETSKVSMCKYAMGRWPRF